MTSRPRLGWSGWITRDSSVVADVESRMVKQPMNLYERIEEQRQALSLLVTEVGGDFLHPAVLAASEALDKLLIAAYRPPGPTVQPILRQAPEFSACDHQRMDGGPHLIQTTPCYTE